MKVERQIILSAVTLTPSTHPMLALLSSWRALSLRQTPITPSTRSISLGSISGNRGSRKKVYPFNTRSFKTPQSLTPPFLLQKVRYGRGEGQGTGEGKGRGTKGQKARTGKIATRVFEGGQTPLTKLYPKQGFFNLSVPLFFPFPIYLSSRLRRPFSNIGAESSTNRSR